MKSITNFKIHKGLPPIAKKTDVVSWDTEFFGMNKNRLHRPDNGTFAFLGCTLNGKDVYYVTDETEIKQFLKNIDAGLWVLQNAKFDITHMRRYARVAPRTKLWDTMLIEQIMYSGYYTDFGLQDLARRYLQVYMPKDVRKEFSVTTKMTKEQIEYAAMDVIATWRIFQKQKDVIDDKGIEVWRDIELPFLWSVLSMSGITLDKNKWLKLAEENGKKATTIQKKFKNVNLNSPAQVLKEITRLGFKVKSTNEESLLLIAPHCKFAKQVLEYRAVARRASTYGAKFVEDHVESDGKIYGDIFQMGAETGRSSMRHPNMQNQPHDPAYRDCFTASKNQVLIIADWGSQEPRLAAYLSQDEKLLKYFKTKKDIYIEIAREILGKIITKKDPLRVKIKALVLGIFYGMSPFGLAKRINVDVEEAEEMISAFFETFPGVAAYDRTQRRSGQYVESIYGRKIWLNHYMNGWERNALNAPIQSSAADAMKIAASRFLREWEGKDLYKNSCLVLLVHDEIVLDVPKKDSKKAKALLKKCMIDTAEEMHPGIPAEVEIYDGPTWASKGA